MTETERFWLVFIVTCAAFYIAEKALSRWHENKRREQEIARRRQQIRIV